MMAKTEERLLTAEGLFNIRWQIFTIAWRLSREYGITPEIYKAEGAHLNIKQQALELSMLLQASIGIYHGYPNIPGKLPDIEGLLERFGSLTEEELIAKYDEEKRILFPEAQVVAVTPPAAGSVPGKGQT